jgi:hypothetical protein
MQRGPDDIAAVAQEVRWTKAQFAAAFLSSASPKRDSPSTRGAEPLLHPTTLANLSTPSRRPGFENSLGPVALKATPPG